MNNDKKVNLYKSITFAEDPNSFNINENMPNSIANYEDMYIEASLTASRKSRSVLQTTVGINNEEKVTVNFLGFNQNKNNSNYLNFTSNYYDGSNPDGEDYESFGITSINIDINSSFIPVVKIQFVDIRGLSFFNRKNSPYRILFDFPPPIFNLIIKGYYGQALEYKLHLVKYQPSFKSENGNFIIDAEFVAVTFAPLSDILFRYVVNGGMIDNDKSLKSDVSVGPENTYDFILKLKQLYTAVDEKFKDTYNIQQYDIEKIEYDKINDLISYNKDFINNTENNMELVLNDFTNINKIIKYGDIEKYISSPINKIFVGYKSNQTTLNFKDILTTTDTTYLNLNTFSKKNNLSIIDKEFTFLSPSGTTKYLCVDFTNQYTKLNNEALKRKTKMNELGSVIKGEVNSMVDGYLGMKPTIFNVFNLILRDVDRFFNNLNACSITAEGHHNEDEVKSKISTYLGTSEDKNKLYAFPLIVENGKKISPKRISEDILKDNPFPEISFIRKFVETFAEQARLARVEDMRSKLDENGVRMWIPISPIDVGQSPYTKCVSPEDFFNVLLNRFYILTQFVYPRQFYTRGVYNNDLVEMFGIGEAYNLLINQSFNSLNAVELELKKYESNDFNDFNSKFGSNYSKIETPEKLPLSQYIPNLNNSSSDNIYIDKNVNEFRGCEITDDIRGIQNNLNDTLKKFIDRSKNYTFVEMGLSDDYIKFTNQNILYISDNKDENFLETIFLYNTIGQVWSDLFKDDPGKEISLRNATKLKNLFNDINISKNIKTILILSNFNSTLTPYDAKHNLVGIVQIPSFVLAYLSLLQNLTEDDKNYLFPISNKIPVDYNFVTTFMSETDKTVFNNFYSKEFDNNGNVDALIEACTNLFNENLTYLNTDNFLDEGGKYYKSITEVLMKRKYLEVFSEKTFSKINNENSVYTPYISYGNEKNKYNNQFFKHFRKTFLDNIKETRKNLNKEAERIKGIIEDEDIYNQTYYSFKNINDKWLTNERDVNGYIFNKKGDSLIKSFVFVDRALNDISDTIINPESLINMFEDTNISVFTVLSRLLSDNRFEFFPLQNFIYHDDISFENAFKIDTSGAVKDSPAFVCMHIGGTASFLSNQNVNGYNDDGILDLRTAELGDFSGIPNDDKNSFFNRVMAFNVSFGQQNQSMFKDIDISGSEHAETNESLQILSRLAGDEQHVAPIPKGQNLYNLYENRSYSATVSGLGNAMIQPTQYFQLQNIPMFNGAYIILSVGHSLTPNRMTTKFTGTKIAKYPTPLVKDSSTIINFDGSIGEILSSVSTITPASTNINPSIFNPINFKVKIKIGDVVKDFNQINAPVDPLKVSFSRGFGNGHYGIDFSGKENTEIWAVKDGIIFEQKTSKPGVGYGKSVVIKHYDGTYSRYGHLNNFYLDVKAKVKAGDVIGFLGNLGKSSGPHLHFEMLYNGTADEKDAIDPKPLLINAMGSGFKWIK
jgi:murein DD-endopeptidase MepM/ murein hydrolase activator NlpD